MEDTTPDTQIFFFLPGNDTPCMSTIYLLEAVTWHHLDARQLENHHEEMEHPVCEDR